MSDLQIVLENKSLVIALRLEEIQRMLAKGEVIFVNENLEGAGYRIGTKEELRKWMRHE